jgi:hypothetical protein
MLEKMQLIVPQQSPLPPAKACIADAMCMVNTAGPLARDELQQNPTTVSTEGREDWWRLTAVDSTNPSVPPLHHIG